MKTTSNQIIRRKSYIVGELNLVFELVRFITYKNKTDIENIAIKDLLVAII
jgi:hypothetical protein